MTSPVDVEQFPYRGLMNEFPVEKMPEDTVCTQAMEGEARLLRVGALLNSTVVPAWVYQVLSNLKQTDGICLALVLLSKPKDVRGRGLRHRAFDAYCDLDRFVFGRKKRSDALRPMDGGNLLRDVTIESTAAKATPSEGDFVASASIDLLLDFGLASLEDVSSLHATYGVMSCRIGDDDVYRDEPALFWEMYEKNPVSATTLRLFNEDSPDGKLLYRSYSRTHPYSLTMNRNEVYWKTAAMFTDQVRRLRMDARTVENAVSGLSVHPRHRGMPTVLQLFKFALGAGRELIARQFRSRFFHERWSIAFTERVPGNEGLPGKQERFRMIEPPRGHFYADPFAMSRDGKEFIFFEDYCFRTHRGRIGCMELDGQSGEVLSNRTILAEDFHMSYPFVFEVDGTAYMIPETSEDRTIRLYRAEAFPWKWKLDTVLFEDVSAVDNTLHWQDGRFWLFASISPPGSSSHDELQLFYAESIRGPWLRHPENPIMTDSRKARGAGQFFRVGESLYRPSQNCSVLYGGSIVLNRVETLTCEAYREKVVDEITPDWTHNGSMRTHTLSRSDRFLVTDTFRYVPRVR